MAQRRSNRLRQRDPLDGDNSLVQLPLKTLALPLEAQRNFLEGEGGFRITQVLFSELRWLKKRTHEIEMIIRSVGLGVRLLDPELIELIRGSEYERKLSDKPRHKGRHFLESTWSLPQGRALRPKRALAEAGMRAFRRERAPRNARTLSEDKAVFHFLGAANFVKGANRNVNGFTLVDYIGGQRRIFNFGGVSAVPILGSAPLNKMEEGWLRTEDGKMELSTNRKLLSDAIHRRSDDLTGILQDLFAEEELIRDREAAISV